ncbi:coenzyme F420 hydrogenase subunit alpha (frhA) [Thermococcus cleftensis]|uniref:Coenzyme F420 hydrogenase subunit alpha (FrhA) n=1 Tax=Thermococcus cleftensis (strain DSM 27260 / KACC 17922 / CL1) TaxID=163003 RepID=I3ZUH0_THECF|nr:nickel-dependent hydrogenase large subunit [Thermococcus cleftensis]AFL95354.1 coenzyme F420 hydrogenase subunit alpha (frhA) [Thermococcus cleftensis]
MGEIAINKMCRVAGEAKLVLYEENGTVTDALFITTAPVRGFEKMVIGKNPLFAVEAVMRICGLCHASHGIAAVEAVEHAIGIAPPRNGLLMREALGLINRTQSHALQFLMIAGDLIKEEKRNEVLFKLMDFHAKVSDYLLKLGGAATHPPNLTIGGMLRVPKWSVFNNLKARFPNLIKSWEELREILLDEDVQTEVAEELRGARREMPYLTSSFFYGDRYNIRTDRVETMPYYEFRKEEPARESTTLVAFYDGKKVETGPRARMKTYREFKDDSLYGLHLARVEDTELALLRLAEILDEINMEEAFRVKNITFGPGRGVGVYEAPRGTLIHYIELGEEGRVVSSKIVVPTMFNIPVMEEMAKGLSVRAAETVMRLYDPCIPCTTHVVRLG